MSIRLLFCFLICFTQASSAQPVISALRIEGKSNPVGIDLVHPHFSWELTSTQPSLIQTQYRILVSSSLEKLAQDIGDIWDSKPKTSDRSIQIPYAGIPLESSTTYYYKVRVWSNQGVSTWSTPQQFTTGLMHPSDRKAKWIGLEKTYPWDSISMFARLSARYFRKEFAVSKTIKKAIVHVSGLGLYELHLNGNKVGEQVLAPAPTDFDVTVLYNSFDVTTLLEKGKNTIGLILGNGRFFTMRQHYKPQKWHNYGLPRACLQLEVEYTDGSRQFVLSDQSWKVTADGPIRTNNEYDGEEYDNTKKIDGWDKTGFNTSTWVDAEFVKAPSGKLQAQLNPPMKVMATIAPRSIQYISPGHYIVDMGQNFSGWLTINVSGKKADTVTLRFAESLQSNGSLAMANLRDAKVTDKYILRGNGVETWHPIFIYHGFRYAEIMGWPGKLFPEQVKGEVVSDDLEVIGSFQSSNAVLNALHKNAYWGILSNYKGMPVDCPQRNERQPWLGDRTTGAFGESFLFKNEPLYSKWVDDIKDAQKPNGSIPDVAPSFWYYYKDNMTWSGAFLNVAEMLHQQFGNDGPIIKQYASMKKWIWYMRDTYVKPDHIMPKDSYGDWCMVPETINQIHARDSSLLTDPTLIATAYYYYFLTLMSDFAKRSNHLEDTLAFQQEASIVSAAFHKKFYHTVSHIYGNGTATSFILPIYFGLVPESEKVNVWNAFLNRVEHIDKKHISTGVIGSSWILRTLHRNGRPDLAYTLATNTTYPSWGYMVKEGATTFWELWNGNTAPPAMNSQNHVMLLGDLLLWMYEDVAGIRTHPEGAGFKKLLLKPAIDLPITDLDVSYKTPYGKVSSQWTRDNEYFSWSCTIPGNTSAEIHLSKDKWIWDKQEDRSIRLIRETTDAFILEAGSGKHLFHFKLRQ